MSEKIKDFGIIFLVTFVAVGWPCYSIWRVAYDFGIFLGETVFYMPYITALIFSVIFTTIVCSRINMLKKLKLWIWPNISNVVFCWVISNLFFISMQSRLMWSRSEAQSLISLEWTIFGISIAIFVFWSPVFFEYLKRQDQEEAKVNSFIRIEKAIYKQIKVSSSVIDAIFVIIDFIVLCIATLSLYMSPEMNVFIQTAILFSFFLCMNTISGLLINVFNYFVLQKKMLLNEMNITADEIETASNFRRKVSMLRSSKISEKEKAKLKTELFMEWFKKISGAEIHDENDEKN